LGKLFSSIGDFFGDIGVSLYENYNTILPILGYMLACAIILFVLLKFLQYIASFFEKLTKKGIFITLIAIVFLWFLASLAFYLKSLI